MIDKIDPIDFMTYERYLVEFLGGEDFETRYKEFRRGRNRKLGTSTRPSPGPDLHQKEDHPLLNMIHQSRLAFDAYWRTGKLELNDAVLDVATLGRSVEEFREATVVDPSGEEISDSIEEIFRDRMWNEEDFWDSAFELEMAAVLSRLGLETYPVEDSAGGPDIMVRSEDVKSWIECKRKRGQTEEEKELEHLKKNFSGKLWNLLDIGGDSFALRISSSTMLQESDLERVVEKTAKCIENQNSGCDINLEGQKVSVELLDYHSGTFRPNYGDIKSSLTGDPETEEILIDQLEPGILGTILGSGIFDHLNFDPPSEGNSAYANSTIEMTEDGLSIHNAFYIIFELPVEIEYWKTIKNSIDKATENLKGYSPSGIFVDVPIIRWAKMLETKRSFKSDTVSGTKRLQISLKGVLADNSSINFAIVTSRAQNRTREGVETIRNGYSIFNNDPKNTLPDSVHHTLAENFNDSIEGDKID